MGTNAAGFRRFCQGFADRENELGSGLNTSFAGFADFADGCEVKNNGGKQERREGGVFFRIFLLDLRYSHTSAAAKPAKPLKYRVPEPKWSTAKTMTKPAKLPPLAPLGYRDHD
jgi:hypothetical protein